MPSYIIYCRKSSESEERQVLSIESQIKEMSELAKRLDLHVSEILTESRSAKEPGRPVFNQMMKKILRGEVKGIISWKLDRIARNPVDGGSISWALDQGQIEEIITPSHHLRNNSNDKFMMQMEFGMAKKYVDDLSDNVRRGLRMKLEKGWLPGKAPIGYLNEPRERTITVDPERFPIVRKMWELLLQGNPPLRIHQIASNELGLRKRTRTERTGSAVTLGAIYKLFVNPFYYGLITRKGNVYQGKHKPMITEDEFWKAQALLGRKGIPRPKTHRFAFTGLMNCGECGCHITAEEKINHYGSHYIYYHCTKKKYGLKCSQGAVQEKDLEAQMVEYLNNIHLPKKLLDFGLTYLEKQSAENCNREEIYKLAREKALRECERRLENLKQMRLGDLINDYEFFQEKRKLIDEKIRLAGSLEYPSRGALCGQDMTKTTLIFAGDAKDRFVTGTGEVKKSIISEIGSNFFLKDKTLSIDVKKPFLLIQKSLNSPHAENSRFELQKSVVNTNSIGSQSPQFLLMCSLVEDVRTFYLEKFRAENGESVRHAA